MKKDFLKKSKKKFSSGVVHICAGFNNTIITFSDAIGNVVCWSSSGKMKFKGSQKGTPYASQIASEDVSKCAIENFGMKTVSVILNGLGAGRESAIKALESSGLVVTSIKDITPVPHGGCRSKKRRRV